MGKQKYYVVWNGLQTGVYHRWADCRRQVQGIAGAVYKSFDTLEEAQRAYASSPHLYLSSGGKKEKPLPAAWPDTVPLNALAVDAACSGNPGPMEYRGVYLATREEIFHFGPLFGTNNIGEFLAIVHGLALLDKQGLSMTIFSDSRTALSWVRQKHCKTQLERTAQTEELFCLIDRAEKWLQQHPITVPLQKWETEQWGEVPADFGRK